MSDSSFKVVIPARYASTRFPGKALAMLSGRPLIQHVYERARLSSAEVVVIATDDQRIADAARVFGANVEFTQSGHESGSDRIAEVVDKAGWGERQIVVNVQGDAPLISPASIDQVAGILAGNASAAMATLCTPIRSINEYGDVNVVKVVMDRSGRALYFSRAGIPAVAHGGRIDDVLPGVFRHVGLYAYRVSALRALTRERPCYLETSERLEQLRALWLGLEIRISVAEEELGPDVDTSEDLDAAERFLDRNAG